MTKAAVFIVDSKMTALNAASKLPQGSGSPLDVEDTSCPDNSDGG